MASGFCHRPSRRSKTGLAPRSGTEMDRRYHQRFGTTMGLSEGEGFGRVRPRHVWPRWNNQQRTSVYLLRGLVWGLLVIAMLHKADFFQEQINQCRRLAGQASNKNDREFWLKMTQRWEGLLVGRYADATAPERVEKIIFRRRRFANRYRAA